MLNNLCYNNFAQKSSPWDFLALGLLVAVYGPGLGPDGPACPENLKPTQFYMLNNLCFKNFHKKIIPGDVRAQVLQEPVGASHGGQGRKSGVPSMF